MRSAELAALAARAGSLATRLLDAHPGVRGTVLLATCNRFEVYVQAEEFHPAVDAVRAELSLIAGLEAAEVDTALTVHAGVGAVEHLFKVACGLDSMVVGEHEIAGQVRQALANADGTASPLLRRLFQAALTTSKAVATQTTLGLSGRSLASVGLDLIDERYGSLAGRRVVVQGTGAYAGVVVSELLKREVTEIRVHSSAGRAEAFAETHDPVAPITSERDLFEALNQADLVVCCSGTGAAPLTADLLSEARIGRETPLVILDLAAAGDVAPDVALLPEADLIDLDTVAEHTPAEQAEAVAAATDLVDKAVATFQHIEGGRRADPAVTAMRAHVSQLIEAEIAAAEARHTPETAAAVARSLRRVSNALLHTPSVRAAELARTGGLEDYTNALHVLFGIDVEPLR